MESCGSVWDNNGFGDGSSYQEVVLVMGSMIMYMGQVSQVVLGILVL